MNSLGTEDADKPCSI